MEAPNEAVRNIVGGVTSARLGASGAGGQGAPRGGKGGVVGVGGEGPTVTAGTAGGGNGKIHVESTKGPITLNGDVEAIGSAGGDVNATAGNGGFGTREGG